MELKLIAFAVFALMASMLPIRYTLSISAAMFASWTYFVWWRVNIPVPEGYTAESTRKLRSFLASFEMTVLLAKVTGALGIGSFVRTKRKILEYMFSEEEDVEVQESDHSFDGVHVRIYEIKADQRDRRPALVWFHGGGWVFGSIDFSSATARRLCKKTNAVIASVGYRLAPEHRFPAAVNDCVAATKYFIKKASQFNVDPTRIGVGGDSAGGNLAAVVSLKLRDEQVQPPLRLQLLVYPIIQAVNFRTPSMLTNADDPLFRSRMMAFCTMSYIAGEDKYNDKIVSPLLNNRHVPADVKRTATPYVDVSKLPANYLMNYDPDIGTETRVDETLWNKLKDGLMDPYFSPLMAGNLNGLPQAYVLTLENDPLRDEELMYAWRLREAGVDVVHYHSDIGIHGMISLAGLIEEADEVFDRMTDYLKVKL